jgi:hypothetical protein
MIVDQLTLAGSGAELINGDDIAMVMTDLKRQVRMERPTPRVTSVKIELHDNGEITYEAEAETVTDCYWFSGPVDFTKLPIQRTSKHLGTR